MRVRMAFGRHGLDIELPDGNVMDVLTMPAMPPLPAPQRAVADALAVPIDAPPLVDLARGRRDAVIVVCDITRPAPNRVMLPPIIEALARAGIEQDRTTILIATGLHRPNEGAELVEMLGPEIAGRLRVVNHRASEPSQQVRIGRTRSGTDVEIDAVYAGADLKITTGFIEPHLMAGFSGGRKLCGIGCGSEATIRGLHAPRIIEHPDSIEGRLDGNILHEELTEIADRVGMDFIVNVTLDETHRVTGVFAGHFERAFGEGCEFAGRAVGRTVGREADIVVTSSAGYPQDINYYQVAKGLTGARHVCKPGGTIIMVAECSEGLGKPEYVELCREVSDVEGFLDRFVRAGPDVYNRARRNDQWQIHNVTRALRKCECHLVDGGLTPEQRGLLLHPAGPSFDEALSAALARHGAGARIVVIPKGPNVLARVG
ncbi:MAG TPA: nickel-dependent lactate racemase [Phycisphaerae bacterium]|nr:nickel-dependent lactate racemase [Phycisphaerae bacterium]